MAVKEFGVLVLLRPGEVHMVFEELGYCGACDSAVQEAKSGAGISKRDKLVVSMIGCGG